MADQVPTSTPPAPELLLDLERYDLLGDGRAALVASCRTMLADDGVVVLPGFVRADGVRALVAEADDLVPAGHRSEVENTPYLGLPDESAPDGHPARALVRSSLTAIAFDRFGPTSPLRALYAWEPLAELVRDVLELPEIHRYADPLGALNVAAMGAGDELGWHFDQTDFVTSIALRSPDVGGAFEVARRLRRSAPDGTGDERPEAVAAVLAGDRGPVTAVPFDPGALMIFAGRDSLHRVTPIGGPTSRLVALLAFDSRPGTDSSDLLKLVRYGRLPEAV